MTGIHVGDAASIHASFGPLELEETSPCRKFRSRRSMDDCSERKGKIIMKVKIVAVLAVLLMGSIGFAQQPDTPFEEFWGQAKVQPDFAKGATTGSLRALPATGRTQMGAALVVELGGVASKEMPLEFRLVDRPSHGEVRLDSGGGMVSAIYMPESGFSGIDSFSYTVSDGTVSSSPAMVRVAVGDVDGSLDLNTASGSPSVARATPVSKDPQSVPPKAFNAANWYISGSLGVGTDTPADDIQLEKSSFPFFEISALDTTNAGIIFNNSTITSSSDEPIMFVNAAGDFNIQHNAGSPVFVFDGATDNIGIQTADAYAPLTMAGTIGWKDGTGHMLQLGETCCTGNDRMILSHSPGDPTWGIFYEDGPDDIHFQRSPTSRVMTVALGTNLVGIGTADPDTVLHIQKNNGSAKLKVEELSGATALRTQLQMINNGPVNTQHETGGAIWRQQFQDNAYTLTKNGTGGNEMTIIAGSGDTTIRGRLYTAGPTCGSGCDAVFEPDFDLESIEEHAAAMWSAGYLPAIGSTVPSEPINLTEKMGGVLNELEKAHIYIEQLHQELAQQKEIFHQELAQQKEQLQRLETLLSENIVK